MESEGNELRIRVDQADGVATVELANGANNFLDAQLIAELVGHLDELSADRSCRAVVLAGSGRHFCAGLDMAAGGITDSRGRHLYEIAEALFRIPLPIVAAVHGAAIGGGLGLAMAADFRVAAPDSRLSANFSMLGFHHGFGLSVTLPRAVGPQRAAELLLTGRRIDGTEAHRIGLCDRLVPPERLRDEALVLAAEIAAAAPLAVRSIRATLRADVIDHIGNALARERREQERLMNTADFREGVRAMRERRPASFTGE